MTEDRSPPTEPDSADPSPPRAGPSARPQPDRAPRSPRPARSADGERAGSGRAASTGRPGWNIWYILLAVWLITTLWSNWYQSAVATIPYSEFLEHLAADRVTELRITSDQIYGRFKRPIDGEQERFLTTRVDSELAERLATDGVEFTGVVEQTPLGDMLAWLLPLMLILFVSMLVVRRLTQRSGGLGGGFMSVGKSKARVYVEEEIDVTFEDVAGVDEAKEELVEIIGFLRNPGLYGRLGARLPKGILLVGPPGTGKTLLARAVAGEAGVPFFSISGSEFVEMFVGVGAARVRDLFEQARKRAPCIIFIDELDALGRARGLGQAGGGHDEKEQTLNQLLVELDGFDPSQGVVLLSATNRPEILDSALLRSGRFDRQILVDRPDKAARVEILAVHLHGVRLAEDVNAEQIAALSPGFTGADLANLVNEAAILGTRRLATHVDMNDFNAALERIVAGLEKRNRLLNPHEREVTAYHEMGHALVSRALPGTDEVHKVSIIPRGIGALGYTIQRPTEDRFLMSTAELENKMAVLLGGRAAEHVVFGEISTGAADDLSKATDIARSMVTRYGMTDELGMVALESDRATFLRGPGDDTGLVRRYSEETAREVDCAVRELISRSFDRAVAVLEQHRDVLTTCARQLLEKETLTGDDLPDLNGSPSTATDAPPGDGPGVSE